MMQIHKSKQRNVWIYFVSASSSADHHDLTEILILAQNVIDINADEPLY